MATKRGILGQLSPGAGSLQDLYTVPALKNASLRVIASNRAATSTAFRVSLALAGAADNVIQYVAFDVPIDANDTGATTTFMVDAADVVRVYSVSGNVSFTATGIEQDQ